LLIKKIPIEKLNPAEYNPRIDLKKGDDDYDNLERSIDKFGYIDPIIWNEQTGNVVGGHQRLKILIDSGEIEVEVSVVNLNIDDEKVLNISLNKISGGWNDEKLSALFEELKLTEVDIAITGFSDKEIDKLIAEFENNEIIDDEFDIDEALPETPITQQGDVWLLGNHKLICGDSTSPETLKLLLGDEKAQLVVTDPPYNVDYQGEAGTIKNDNMSKDNFYQFLHAVFSNVNNVMDNGASIYIFHSETEGCNFISAFKDVGFHHSGTCVWVKQSFVFGRCDYQWKHEPVIYGWKVGAPHNWYSDRSQSTVWEFDRPTKSEDHPTMKPIPLCAYPITNSSKPGEIVLDAFGGSGSVLIACEQTNRFCRMVELDEKYCDVIVKRYILQTGDVAILLRNGEKINYTEL